jgi:hypothetical protein
VATKAKRFLGIFGQRQYDALMTVKLPNGDRLNHVFEKMVVAYAPRLLPGSEASQVARDKRKAKVLKKPTAKRAKTGMSWVTLSKMVSPPFRSVPAASKMTPPLSKVGP